MEAKLTNKSPESIKTDALILPFTTESLKKLKPKTKLEKIIKQVGDDFKADKDQILSLTGLGLNAKKVILCGLGAEKELNPERLRRSLSIAIKSLNVKSFVISLLNVNLSIKDKITSATETVVLSTYNFDKYKAKKDKKVPVKEALLAIKEPMGKYQTLVKESQIICNNTNFVRDLVNENSEETTTLTLTNQAKALAAKYKSVRIKVLTEKEIKRQKLNLIHAHILFYRIPFCVQINLGLVQI